MIACALASLVAAGALSGCVNVGATCTSSIAFVEGRLNRSTRCEAGVSLLMFETAPAIESDEVTPLDCCRPGGP